MELWLCSIYFSKLQRKQMNSVILEILENATFKSKAFRHPVFTNLVVKIFNQYNLKIQGTIHIQMYI
jgi:hypothetical protein